VAWYPTLIAVLVVVEPFTQLDLPVASGARALAAAVVIGATVTLLATLALGRDRGGAVAGLVVIGLIAATSPVRAALVAIAIALLLVEWIWSRRGTMTLRIPWPAVTRVLNAILVVLLLLEAGRAGVMRATAQQRPIPAEWTISPVAAAPDIYIVVVDGYGRRDVLRDGYGLAEDPLAAGLQLSGFEESPRSWANHTLTRFSLATLLNGSPMSELGQDLEQPADDNLAIAALGNSNGMHALRTAGYETVIISAGYDHLGLGGSDVLIDVGPRNELEQTLLSRTAIGSLVDAATGGYLSSVRTRMRLQLDAMLERASTQRERPEFVLVHLPLPHWPYVLDKDCQSRAEDTHTFGAIGRDNRAGTEESIEVVAGQTACIGRLVADAVRNLVVLRPDAVLIVLSDHGPEERLDWWDPDARGLRERLANLFWARTPGRQGVFGDEVSLVNVFPLLLNAYLGARLSTSGDELFYGPGPDGGRFLRYEPEAGEGAARAVDGGLKRANEADDHRAGAREPAAPRPRGP
jgi:hypothetical protein